MILISALAAALWVWLLSRLDAHPGERMGAVLPLFVAGGVASAVVARQVYRLLYSLGFFDTLLDDLAGSFAVNVFLVGPLEEMSKLAAFVLLSSLRNTIHEPRDGLLQAAAVGLGFAVAENVGYGRAFGLDTMLLRSLLTCVGHMILASIWGAQWTLMSYEGRQWKGGPDFRRPAAALMVAALDHGLYNFMLRVEPAGSMAADFATLIFALAMLAAFQDRSPYRWMGLWRWKTSIPDLEAALLNHPASYVLRRKLAL